MKWIKGIKKIKINPINKEELYNIIKFSKKSWIINTAEEDYFVIKRNFENNKIDEMNEELEIQEAKCKITTDLYKKEIPFSLGYGGSSSIIVDANGIDNFRFAKALVLKDSVVRKIMIEMNLIEKGEQYLRFGASGSRENKFHPGGEVFEYSVINGDDASGTSQSISGCNRGRRF